MQLTQEKLRSIIERIDIARSVYSAGLSVLPPRWSVVAESAPDSARAMGFYGRLYKKEPPLSEGEAPYIFSFRGTHKGSDIRDLVTDINIFFHRIPNELERALSFVKTVCRDNDIDIKDVEFAGHSSGGYLARTVAMILGGNRVWAFNSPGPSANVRRMLTRRFNGNRLNAAEKLFQIRSASDIVGKWGYDEGLILEVPTVGDHHSLSQLREGLVAMLEGREPATFQQSKKKFSLRRAYNKFSERVTGSPKIRRIIYKLSGNNPDKPPRSSRPRPA